MRFILFSFLLLAFVSCASAPEKPDSISFARADFSDLPGWHDDHVAEALSAFKISCTALAKNPKQTAEWGDVCAVAQETPTTDDAARAFFENQFTPYAVLGSNGDEGLFTGYYMPLLRGSLKRAGPYQTPLYARPKDMISVDLGAFKSDLKSQHIVGKAQGQKLVPYDSRAEIAKGALKKRARILVWVDDPVGAFFLEVQGSGLIRRPDGKIIAVGYDGSNGRAYISIGRVLADRGAIPRPVTMDSIRAFLSEHPAQAQEILNQNSSYVFFRRLPDTNAVGAEGVALTPLRSLAIDPAFVPLGAPLWLDTEDARGNILQRLMIAQDTGGAIKGPVRGDFYWGAGPQAAAEAGAMQSRGHYYILLPKNVNPDDGER